MQLAGTEFQATGQNVFKFFTFTLLGGAAASLSSPAFLPQSRHLPLQPLQTLLKGGEVRLAAALPGSRTRWN